MGEIQDICIKIGPLKRLGYFVADLVQNKPMICGYARVSTDGQSVAAQVAVLRKHGAGVFREVASGAKTDWAQICRLLDQLGAGDVLLGYPARPLDP